MMADPNICEEELKQTFLEKDKALDENIKAKDKYIKDTTWEEYRLSHPPL